VINDLRATGDTGPDPRSVFPEPACHAYVAFNVYTALRAPLARLGIAAVLEGIGGTHGSVYGAKVVRMLGLKKTEASFFLGHGAVDTGHANEVLRIIDASDPSGAEWEWLAHAARMAGILYRRMYDEVRP